ncbi:MAG TPA: J domain-containing protein [Acidimicrobiales bacterium]|nr:J domain-containing protein [Acidimicrobiales bacterium]
MTHYEVLGVEPTADAATVRRAYLRLARENHPDFHTGDDVGRRRAERRMQQVNEAWSVLGDEEARRAYDRALGRPSQPRPGFEPKRGPSWHPGGAGEDPTIDPDLEDDEPLTGASVRGSWTLLPVALFASSVILFAVAMVLQAAPLLALSMICFAFSLLGFVLLPFLAMGSSRRDDLADGGRA